MPFSIKYLCFNVLQIITLCFYLHTTFWEKGLYLFIILSMTYSVVQTNGLTNWLIFRHYLGSTEEDRWRVRSSVKQTREAGTCRHGHVKRYRHRDRHRQEEKHSRTIKTWHTEKGRQIMKKRWSLLKGLWCTLFHQTFSAKQQETSLSSAWSQNTVSHHHPDGETVPDGLGLAWHWIVCCVSLLILLAAHYCTKRTRS